MNQLGELAYSIWDIEFGDHSSALEREKNALLISGYLEANLGQLNILINTNFQLTTGQMLEPKLKHEEQAIFTQLYLKDFYQKQSRNILRGMNPSSSTSTSTGVTDWTELREGDSVIKRSVNTATAKNESARAMTNASRDASDMLEKLIHSYNMYGSVPIQVAGKDAES